MKGIFLTTLMVGACLTGLSQNKDNKNVTIDFFYETWTDSTKTGFILSKDGKLLKYPKRDKRGGESLECSYAYKIFLDLRPILIEVTAQCDDTSGHNVTRAQIKIANERQIYITALDQDGRPKKTQLFTKD